MFYWPVIQEFLYHLGNDVQTKYCVSATVLSVNPLTCQYIYQFYVFRVIRVTFRSRGSGSSTYLHINLIQNKRIVPHITAPLINQCWEKHNCEKFNVCYSSAVQVAKRYNLCLLSYRLNDMNELAFRRKFLNKNQLLHHVWSLLYIMVDFGSITALLQCTSFILAKALILGEEISV